MHRGALRCQLRRRRRLRHLYRSVGQVLFRVVAATPGDFETHEEVASALTVMVTAPSGQERVMTADGLHVIRIFLKEPSKSLDELALGILAPTRTSAPVCM